MPRMHLQMLVPDGRPAQPHDVAAAVGVVEPAAPHGRLPARPRGGSASGCSLPTPPATLSPGCFARAPALAAVPTRPHTG